MSGSLHDHHFGQPPHQFGNFFQLNHGFPNISLFEIYLEKFLITVTIYYFLSWLSGEGAGLRIMGSNSSVRDLWHF